MDCTVVVCTRNRRASLLETLASLAAQRAAAAWEILVVDNGSADGTPRAVEELAASLPAPLRLAVEPEAGLSRARNRGLEAARGEAVLFIDDDVTCLPGWLAAHAAAFQDPAVAGTAGRILPVLPPGTPADLAAVLAAEIGGPTSRYDFGPQPGPIPREGEQPPPFGANMGVRRAVALRCGGFRTDLGWGRSLVPSEETEFFRRVRAAGGTLLYAPAAALQHRIAPERATWRYYWRWQRGYGRATVRMDPPGDLHARLRLLRREAQRVLRYAHRSMARRLARDRTAAHAAARIRAQSAGRLLELLGL